MTTKLGWFTSANGRGSQKMLYKALHKYPLEAFSFVLVANEEGMSEITDEIIGIVRSNKIPCIFAPYNGRPREYDKIVAGLASRYDFDIGVMAGYMHFVPQLCKDNFVINLHPDIPGRYTGAYESVMRNIICYRDTEGGAFVHRAGDTLDVGEVYSEARFSISNEERNPDDIRKKMLQIESDVLIEALDKLMDERGGGGY